MASKKIWLRPKDSWCHYDGQRPRFSKATIGGSHPAEPALGYDVCRSGIGGTSGVVFGVLWPATRPRRCSPVKQELTKESMWTLFVHVMKTVTVRDLRNSFSMLEAWLSEGEDILIEKRGLPIGVLTAWRPEALTQPAKPDFAARRRAIWGNRVFTDAEVAAMRADELEGEEG